MKLYPKLWKNLITISILLSIFLPTQAATITPPSLLEVIKKNEEIQRRQIRKNRIPKTLILSTEENLSYHTIKRQNAVEIIKYDTVDLWVQSIDLKKGAYMESIIDLKWYDEVSGEPLFEKKKITEIQKTISKRPLSIINGQFFDPSKKNTPLSFWLKVDGIIRTAWADNRDENKNILIFDKNIAKIIPYSWENLRDSPGYFAMVNLSFGEWHYANESIGRTYICLKNPNIENESSEVLVFTATTMTEWALEKEILRFGCTKKSTAKLDSSGSSQLWFDNNYIYGFAHRGSPDQRSIPHAIAIYDSI